MQLIDRNGRRPSLASLYRRANYGAAETASSIRETLQQIPGRHGFLRKKLARMPKRISGPVIGVHMSLERFARVKIRQVERRSRLAARSSASAEQVGYERRFPAPCRQAQNRFSRYRLA